MLAFFWLWFRTAFRQSLGPIDLWSGVVAAIVGVTAHFWPSGAETMTALTWQIPLWVLGCVMLVRLLMAPYWLWKSQQENIANAESELRKVIDEYAHALALERIDYEEGRQKNEKGEIIDRRQGVALLLRNTIARPLRYTVRTLKINGVEGEDYQNRGGVVSPLAHTTFYSSKQQVSLEGMDKYQRLEIDLEIEYGPPGKPLRLMSQSASLDVYPENQGTRFITKNETEEPIGGH